MPPVLSVEWFPTKSQLWRRAFSWCTVIGLTACPAAGQSVAGEWRGHLGHKACTGINQGFQVRLRLQGAGQSYSGDVAYFFPGQDHDNEKEVPLFSFPVNAIVTDGELKVAYRADEELNARRFVIGYYVMGGYTLLLHHTKGEEEGLNGLYRGSNGGRGEIRLRKHNPDAPAAGASNNDIFQRLRQRQQQRKEASPPAVNVPVWQRNDSLRLRYESEQATAKNMALRRDSLFTTVRVKAHLPEINLSLYDNAEIDGDTVSLFVNGVLVLHKAALTGTPLVHRLYRPDDGKPLYVKVVAENLGRIPPNTAVAQVDDGTNVRRLSLQSDLKTNGVIALVWQ